MKSNIKVFVFISLFILALSLPKLNATSVLPLPGPDAIAPHVSLDFKDASLKDVIKVLSIQSGLNFIASEAVQDRKITLYMDKVPLEDAMDQIFKANNLSYELDKDASIFIVKDWGKPDVEVETKVFYLKYASVSSSHIMEQIGSSIAPTTSGTEGSSTTTTSTSSTSDTSTSGDRYAVSSDIGITTAIKKLLSKNGNVIEDYRTNSLIVQDIPSRIPAIAKTIAALDVPTQMVLIEVEMLDVSKNAVDKMGFKFGQTPLSVAITGATATAGFPYGSWTKFLDPQKGSISINSGASAYTVQLDWLRTLSDTKYLARPRILTLNNETAEFKIEAQTTVYIDSTTISQGTNPVTNTIPQQVPTGVTLRVTPQINPETGEITMFIMPTLKETVTTGFTVASNAVKDVEERTTKQVVRVGNGETIVLGGLIRKTTSETITKLPVLGDLPLIGGAFRHKNKDKDEDRELLVFITPRIVKDTKLAAAKNLEPRPMPMREQSASSAVDRQQLINSTLNTFERKKK